eukprot:TRINITY_DN5362_c0_g1_i6.p1 TRINITY_DN5362_c0_g1~~TRINITY_DN5362_c0_g1_i6.p1  ORF type:complete len:324 (-),score=45.29 TRINITY_DN5362_c0_g1_i6:545-1516(-)
MYRYCASGGVDRFADVRELLGSEERKLIRQLQAAEAQVRSENEAGHRAFENLEVCRGEFQESESERRQERDTWRAELASRTMEVVRREQSIQSRARREIAEARSKCESERTQAFYAGAQQGEEVMLSQLKDALARAVQCGREEGSAEIRAKLKETSESLRVELDSAEEVRTRAASELTAEGREFSRYKEDTAQEIEELRTELTFARAQKDSYCIRASRMQNRRPSTKQQDGFSNILTANADGTRHDCSDAEGEERVTTGLESLHRAFLCSDVADQCVSSNTIQIERSKASLTTSSVNAHGRCEDSSLANEEEMLQTLTKEAKE